MYAFCLPYCDLNLYSVENSNYSFLFQAVRTKYSSSKFMKISQIPELKSQLLKDICTGVVSWDSSSFLNVASKSSYNDLWSRSVHSRPGTDLIKTCVLRPEIVKLLQPMANWFLFTDEIYIYICMKVIGALLGFNF